MNPDHTVQMDYHKMQVRRQRRARCLLLTLAQLIGTLNQVAMGLRECANAADAYAHQLSGFAHSPNGSVPFLANGQFPMSMPGPAPMHEEGGKKRKSRADDGEGKRKKKLKDPNAPKRPPSSYLIFQNDIRSELKAKNPGMPNNELLGTISKLWAAMPQERKDAYEARNKAAKETWIKEKAIYEGKTDVKVPPVAIPVAVPAPVPSVEASSEDSHDEEESEADESSSDDDKQSPVAPPPTKKSKKDVAAITTEEGKKEKKHKKTKA
ncbi:high mobility group box domain-containing protein [Daedaleopsis nitida]|nr:high mobility group box domain-containing protein [Daedaleopsis nitida]